MSDHVYFDASAVLRWAFCEAGSSAQRDVDGHRELEKLLASDASLALSPLTLLEVLANLNQKIRDTTGWYAGLDAQTAATVISALMGHLKAGQRIEIRELGNRAYEVSLMWINESIANPQARILQKWDGIHLYEAVRWSRELGPQAKVILATADSDFEAFLGVLPELREQITVSDVCAS